VGYVSRSSGLLRLVASQDRVFQFDLKTSGGKARVVHMVSSRKLRQSETKDGRLDSVGCRATQVGPNYPYFVVVFFFSHKAF
jgi:hypothetical protein